MAVERVRFASASATFRSWLFHYISPTYFLSEASWAAYRSIISLQSRVVVDLIMTDKSDELSVGVRRGMYLSRINGSRGEEQVLVYHVHRGDYLNRKHGSNHPFAYYAGKGENAPPSRRIG